MKAFYSIFTNIITDYNLKVIGKQEGYYIYTHWYKKHKRINKMKMKARILALLFLFVGVNSIYGQTSEKYLYKILQSDKERMSDDRFTDNRSFRFIPHK